MTRQVLSGLRPEPLGSYLAGLGLIRLVGDQADADATAAWNGDGLAIDSTVPDLAVWLAEAYVPTPVFSPWNGGSGFGAKDVEPKRRIEELRSHPSPRLAPLRAAIGVAEEVATASLEGSWDKSRAVQEFRNRCPDALLPWIDAAVVLADDQAYFPPLLGTGGNDGRLDFSTNFHQRLLDVLDESPNGRKRSLAWARDLLAGSESERLIANAPVGQFDPAAAGGQASSPFGAATSMVNPWAYVLLVEGALLFASGAARRHQHAAGRAAMPFTVRESPDGFGSGAAGEASRGELWVPVWTRPCTLAEIRQLFGEARASWNGRPAQRAVEFYAATRTLGVARGVDEFVRYGLHQRNGLAFVAVPEDRIRVRERPEVRLVADVEEWVSRVRSSDASSAVGVALRRFDSAHLEYVRADRQDAGELRIALLLRRLLAELTGLEQAVGHSGRVREVVPVRRAPRAAGFLAVLRHADCAELRVAVGIASCATVTRPGAGQARTMRQILLPVGLLPDAEHRAGQWRDSPLVPGLGLRPLREVLADVLTWRSRTAEDEPESEGFRGVPTFRVGAEVPAADLHAFAAGRLTDTEVMLWLRACLALDWRRVNSAWPPGGPVILLPTLGLLHPLASGLVVDHTENGQAARGSERAESSKRTSAAGPAGEQATRLGLRPDWAARLAAGKVQAVHGEAVARLRQAGWEAVPAPRKILTDGVAIAAALVPRCQDARDVMTRSNLAFRLRAEETEA